MKTCPKCGFENQDDYNFCERCRYDFKNNTTIKQILCPSCGETINSDSHYCYKCGAPIKQTPKSATFVQKPAKKERKIGCVTQFAILLIVLWILLALFNDNNDNDSSNNTTEEITTEATTETQIPTLKEFKEKSEKVSYEDLLRYPETYKDKMIKVTVSVKELQAASLSTLFKDAYMCTLDNQTIFCTDYRETQEPSIVKGDKITIYGYGDGQATLTEKEKNALGITTSKDKSYIPSVRIIYVKLKK